MPLLAASGDEIAWALRRAGFHTRAVDPASMTLERDLSRVVVPRGRLLEHDELRAILDAADVSYIELLDLLDQAEREAPAESGTTLPAGRRKEAR